MDETSQTLKPWVIFAGGIAAGIGLYSTERRPDQRVRHAESVATAVQTEQHPAQAHYTLSEPAPCGTRTVIQCPLVRTQMRGRAQATRHRLRAVSRAVTKYYRGVSPRKPQRLRKSRNR